jgi:HlyD family secretion protein
MEPSPAPTSRPPWASPVTATAQHRWRRALPWLIALIIVGIISYGLWPKPIEVEVGAVAISPLAVSILEEGKTRVRHRYEVAAPTTGTLERVTLRPGDPVKAGKTVLFRIKPSAASLLDPRARRQAEAFLAQQLDAEKRQAQVVEAARLALVRAQAERDRIAAEKIAGIVSATERDAIEAEAAIKAAELRAVEFGQNIAQFEVDQARLALELPSADDSDAMLTIKSPVDGTVLRVMQESETIVGPGTPILEVGDTADLEIEAEILSRDAMTIAPGATARMEQWGGEPALEARVRRIEPTAFTKISALGVEEQRVLVLLDLVNPPASAKTLGDRYRVEARINTWSSENVLTVPASALFRMGNEWKTFVVRHGKAHLTPVNIGHSDGKKSEVLDGLQAGDQVILHPPDSVADQARVSHR